MIGKIEIIEIVLKPLLGYAVVWMWNVSHRFLHLDILFPRVALFGKAMETWWGGSLKEVGTGGGPWLLIVPPTSCLISTRWLKTQCGHLLHLPAVKPPCHNGLYPLRLWPLKLHLSGFWSQHKKKKNTNTGYGSMDGMSHNFTSQNLKIFSFQTLYNCRDECGLSLCLTLNYSPHLAQTWFDLTVNCLTTS